MRILLLLVFLLSYLDSYAQTRTVAVLKQRYAHAQGTARHTALLDLLEEHRSHPADSMSKYAHVLQRSNPGDNKTQALAAYYLAIYHLKANQLDSALFQIDRGLATTRRKERVYTWLHLLRGGTLVRLNRRKEALADFFFTLRESENRKDRDGIVRALNGIGWVQMEIDQHRKAVSWFRKALAADTGRGTPRAMVLSNLAASYRALGRSDSARWFIRPAINLAKKIQDMSSLANAYAISAGIELDRGQRLAALKSMQQTVAIRKILDEPFYIVSDLCLLSDIFAASNRTIEGIATAQEAMRLADAHHMEAKIPMVYAALGNNYRAAGEYRLLAQTLETRLQLKDSAYSDALSDAFAAMQARYETAKKQQQISLLRSRQTLQQMELSRRNTVIAITSAALVAVLAIGFLLYNRSKLKQKSALQAEVIRQQTIATNKVLRAEENERKRIALELHDGLGQLFSVVKLNLSGMTDDLVFKSETSEQTFTKLLNMVDECCREIRMIAHQMAPHILISSGLPAAVRDFVEKIDARQLKTSIDVVGFEGSRLPANIESVLFRVIQECVNNVIKHAKATSLDIQLIREEQQTTIMIEDNGRGFDTHNIDLVQGMGLTNIRSRIDYLKGTVDFSSLNGRGTLIAIYLPF